MKPFLRKEVTSEYGNNYTSMDTNANHYPRGNSSGVLEDNLVQLNVTDLRTESNVQYCYFIVAGCLFTLSMISFVIFICGGCRFWKKKHSEKNIEDKRVLITGKGKLVVLVMCFLQAVMSGGIEEIFGGLMMTFVVKYLHLSKDTGSDMATVFWASVALSRCLGIVVCKYVRATRLLAVQLSMLLAVSITLAFAVDKHWIVPWICFAVAGLSTGSVLATLINWANSCIHLKGKETAVFFAGVSFSKMTIPPLIGFLFQMKDPMWFTYMILILAVVFQILFWANLLLVHCLIARARGPSKETPKGETEVL